jgi:hypothetical protein
MQFGHALTCPTRVLLAAWLTTQMPIAHLYAYGHTHITTAAHQMGDAADLTHS